jgi:hypothetical protein
MMLALLLHGLLACEKMLIGPDPYPYAEVSSYDLIRVCRDQPHNCTDDMLKELDYRLHAGMLMPEEIKQTRNLLY